MRGYLKNLVLITLILITFATTAVIADSNQQFIVTIDGVPVNFTDSIGYPVLTQKSRTFVPIRVISENMGYDVDWSKDTWNSGDRRVWISDGTNKIEITIDSPKAMVNGKEIYVDYDENKNPVTESKAFIMNDRTYLPLRFISEAFGKEVGYKNVNKVHHITIGKQPSGVNFIEPEFEIIQGYKHPGKVAFMVKVKNIDEYVKRNATFETILTTHTQFNKYEIIDIWDTSKWLVIDKSNAVYPADRVKHDLGIVYEFLIPSNGVVRNITTKEPLKTPNIGDNVGVRITINIDGIAKVYDLKVPYEAK